jgi:hypothetical protein
MLILDEKNNTILIVFKGDFIMRKTKVILPIVFLTLLFALVGCGSKTTTINQITNS